MAYQVIAYPHCQDWYSREWIEMDLKTDSAAREREQVTEQIISRRAHESRITLHHKFAQYDRYLRNKRFAQTYGAYGEFSFFIMLFVTLSRERLENIRRELADLPADLAPFYRLTTFNEAMADFFSQVWQSRALSDTVIYPLVQESAKP